MLEGGPVELFIVRHGECAAQMRGAHDPDSPLTAGGRRQAALVGTALAARGVTAIVSSPLVRALETAQSAAAGLGLPNVAVWTDLREHYATRHRGHGTATLRGIARWRASPRTSPRMAGTMVGYPGVGVRALGRVRAEYGDESRIALITHGGCANTLAHVLLDTARGRPSPSRPTAVAPCRRR